MRFQFESDLEHQAAAIEAVCDLFKGQEINQTSFTVAPAQIEGQLALAEKTLGYGNRLSLLDDEILANLRAVQNRNCLETDSKLDSMNFTVEMETGTGKTYAYLRTIFELNKRFGFTKFVIVVPSIAIREGVKKSIEQTRDHFRALYDGVPFDYFVYDSSDLSKIRDFASASTIKVMVATIQSLGTKTAVFQQAREQTQDIPAVEWVAETRPIIIIDEPQSVDANPEGAGRKIMLAMNPLATIRYSATHVHKFHQVYRLDAFDAHDRGLVKSIEVDGANIKDADSSPYVKLVEVEARKGHAPRARIEVSLQGASEVRRDTVWAYEDDELVDLSNGRTVYAGMRIGTVDARRGGSIQLVLPGDIKTLREGESHADVNPDSLARHMVRQTIEHHFEKEKRNRKLGIKTLSLFFVARVADYRLYDEDTGTAKPGPLATVFEEEYLKLAHSPEFRDDLFGGVPPDPKSAHGGYFAQDKRSITPFDEKTFAKSTKDEAVETRTFDLIMRDKEKLLDEKEPLRFLFSHSALREGWDNPNVFQICALREMASEGRRRQSIGRGLRLCVDQHGQRRRDEGLNVLTVVSDETFGEYADNLQKEMEEALDVKLGVVDPTIFAGLHYPTADGGTAKVTVNESQAIYWALSSAGMIESNGKVNDRLRLALKEGTVPLPPELSEAAAKLIRDRLTRLARKLNVRDANKKGKIQLNLAVLEGHDFKTLWDRISRKTTYRLKFDDEELIKNCVEGLKGMPSPGEARVTFERADVHIGKEGIVADRTSTSVPRRLASARLDVPDLLGELQNRTELPRKVLAQILVQSGRLSDVRRNPAAFIDACDAIIKERMRLVMVNGIQYQELDDSWFAQDLFVPMDDVNQEKMVAVTKAPVDHIIFDSETIEKKLAEDMQQSKAIKVFAKLPEKFKISTPLGTYNPDWAIVRETEEGQQIYLVTETKGSLSSLRPEERAKIDCGKAHFDELSVPFLTATNLDQVLNGTPVEGAE
jgi:type III restriction enzyme